jgi:hypothetical protein
MLIRRDIIHNIMFLHQFSNPDNTILVTTTNPPIHIDSSYLPSYDTLVQDRKPIETFLTTVKPCLLHLGTGRKQQAQFMA